MIEASAAKRLVLHGQSDLDLGNRRTIALAQWADCPGGWQAAAPGGRRVRIQTDGRGLFLHLLDAAGKVERNVSVAP
jgi:hypothetical protein